jgi:TolB protein
MKLRLVIILAIILGRGECGAEPPQTPPSYRLTFDGYFKQRPNFSPDGNRLVFARYVGTKVRLFLADIESAVKAEEAAKAPIKLVNVRRLTENPAGSGRKEEYDAVWSPDGSRLAFTYNQKAGSLDVFTITSDGSALAPFALTGDKLTHQQQPSWSPDGRRIAFTSSYDGNHEIYVANVPVNGSDDGGKAVRLTNDLGLDVHPSWSPDGRRIVFSTARWGDLELAVMDADGSKLKRLTRSPRLDDYPVFSPDGRQIAFTSNRDRNFEIYVMNADGSEPHNLTRNPAIDQFPSWRSPRGETISFVSNRDGGFDIYLLKR